jgi:hypothetical protein
MYLPTFQKITHELIIRRTRVTMLSLGVAAVTFGPFLFFNQLYNFVYRDIFPP